MHQFNKRRLDTKRIVLLGLLTTILFVSQIVFASIPNIEVVSLLIIVYTIFLGKQVFYIIYGFAILEGIFYGFGIWWVMYLYVWSILAVISLCFRRQTSIYFWSMISGGFGLVFGFLCSLPYFVAGGMYAGISYWVSGIPFDLLHCIGNIVCALVLFRPLVGLFHRLEKTSD